MKVVIDTNVVAYLLLGPAIYAAEARPCVDAASDLLAPAHWEAELINVVWLAVRAGVVPADEGPKHLDAAWRLGIQPVPVAAFAEGALLRSIGSGVAAYDSLFVELAVRTGCLLVTFDKALIRAFPEIACRPSDLNLGG